MKVSEKFNLLPADDLEDKLSRIRAMMTQQGIDSVFIADNCNKYYLTGRMFSGFILITSQWCKWFLRRPSIFDKAEAVLIRKVENVAEHVDVHTLGRVGFELNTMPYADVMRYAKALDTEGNFANADTILAAARAVKTDYEISMIEESSDCLARVYARVPTFYEPGMTDIDLQIKVEAASRKEGCIGLFRINGQEMELNMGSVLVGDNADNPSPYDFAMGGAGMNASLPVGANWTVIRPGNSVMVDTNGDFTGYMTDMTRTFACGQVSAEAESAHRLSIEICERLAAMGCSGVAARELYNEAVRMAEEAGLADRFMGHRSQAGFVGHGVGIAINEGPVIAPRSRDILQKNNVIALEPKFVMEGVGAVGVENTYVVTDEGMRKLTHAPEEMIRFVGS